MAVDDLTDEAKELLRRAADSDGSILCSDHLEGTVLQISGVNVMEGRDARTQARFKSALRQLEAQVLVLNAGGKGVVFELTGPGYDTADLLKAQS